MNRKFTILMIVLMMIFLSGCAGEGMYNLSGAIQNDNADGFFGAIQSDGADVSEWEDD